MNLTNVGIVFSPTTDGAVTLVDDPLLTNFNDTESPIASKDVLLILTHGVCVVNGATATIIKRGCMVEKGKTTSCV